MPREGKAKFNKVCSGVFDLYLKEKELRGHLYVEEAGEVLLKFGNLPEKFTYTGHCQVHRKSNGKKAPGGWCGTNPQAFLHLWVA